MSSRNSNWPWIALGILLTLAMIGWLLVLGKFGPGTELAPARPSVTPAVMGTPILECADGSWVDNRAPGACFDHGGLPNE